MSKQATVKIQLWGNPGNFPDEQPGITVINGRTLLEVEEHSLPGIVGLVRHSGAGEYLMGIQTGEISSGDKIRIYHGKVNPGWVEFGFTDYAALNENSMVGGYRGQHSPGRTLMDQQWYHLVTERNPQAKQGHHLAWYNSSINHVYSYLKPLFLRR